MSGKTAESLTGWISKGFSKQAVAAYGTSVEFLERIITSDQIPAGASSLDQHLLPYQKELLLKNKGGYLYYTFPIIENMALPFPHVVTRALLAKTDLSHDGIRYALQNYAGWQALRHRFESLTGKKIDDFTGVVGLTYSLFPTLVTQYQDDQFLQSALEHFKLTLDWQDPPLLGLEDSTLSIAELKDICAKSISRRGIIIYFNKRILNYHLLAGFEDQAELLIHSQKPLALEVISGIETLAESDKKAVESLISK